MKFSSFVFTFTVVFVLVIYMGTGCANIGSPTGGAKDTLAPTVLSVSPALGTLNYKEPLLQVVFDEPVTLKNLQTQLIVTPRTDIKYKAKVNKNVVELRFDQPLKDSTTYTLSFRECIVDITEGNIAKDVYLAFSTGSYLDSLVIAGNVKDALSDKPIEGATVAIYNARDTANVFKHKPDYFSQTDKEGRYELRNLKRGDYLVYAFSDKNKNLTLQTKSESYGYWPDTIRLTGSVDSVDIRLFSVTADKPKISSARPVATYYEINFNKALVDYQLQVDGTTPLYSNFIEGNKKVRVYPAQIQDSVRAIITATDSIQQQLIDTVFIRFTESKRAKAPFTANILPKSGAQLTKENQLVLEFTKPVAELRVDSIKFMYDSLNWETVSQQDVEWNARRSKVTIKKTLTPPKQPVVDVSTETDPQKLARGGAGNRAQEVELRIPKGSIFSIEGDSADNQTVTYRIATESQTGTLSGNVATTAQNFIVQLLKANTLEVVSEKVNARQYMFRFVEPGDYLIRVVIDRNANGRWDPGDIYKLEAPEPVYIVPQPITMKPNWEIQNPEILL